MEILLCVANKSDRELCLEHLSKLALKTNTELSITQKDTSNGALFYLDDVRYVDLVYVGIQEPEQDGIALATKLRKHGVTADIVFLTQDARRMSEAFDVEALHYLVPGRITRSKFEEVFLKALARSNRRNQDVITFSCAGEWRQVPIASIRYFEVEKRIITVYYENEKFEFYSTLSRIEEKLYGRGFIRIHRSILISKHHVKSATTSEVIMKDKTVLPVGRQYAGNLHATGEVV